MTNVTIRFNAVLLKADGNMFVDAVLPDGSHYRGVVAGNRDREELALALAGVEGDRVIPGMTGLVDVDEAKWNTARAAAKAAADAVADEAVETAPAETAPASGKAEKASEKASK